MPQALLLCNIFKSSYETGDIPAILKLATIVPIHKGGSRSEASNFRPISLTSHIIKTFERVLRKTLVSYLEYNKKMDPKQHGSRAGRSTLSQLLEHQDAVPKALEDDENLDSIYLDFSKAFNKCDHGILLHKIKSLGIKGKIGRWIYSFLIGRLQEVLVKGHKSSKSPLKSGVPQGSVLGPILFLIYVSDIGEDLVASVLVYVDDTKLTHKVKNEKDVEFVQDELKKLHQWGQKNNMEFNGNKFQVVRYGQDVKLKEDTIYLSGDYEEVIDQFSSLRDLGVQLTDDATFSEHIENICKKVRQKCGWLHRSFYTRNPNFMKHMFNSLIQPHIDYCSQLWMPQEGQNLDKLEKLLRDFTRKMPGLKELNYWERLKKMKMSSEQRRLERYQMIYIWKMMEDKVPNCGVAWSSDSERKGRMCAVPALRGRDSVKTLRTQSFQVSGPRLFNCLPKNIRNMTKCDLEKFKEKLDNFLSKVPDEPKTETLIPGASRLYTERQSNSLLYQVARREGTWSWS